ncbi:MAG: hypothetical protein M3325_12650, partial [Actinomycetota bacterium]|nr:hypothetical protein [Actinomycetota bacterium]
MTVPARIAWVCTAPSSPLTSLARYVSIPLGARGLHHVLGGGVAPVVEAQDSQSPPRSAPLS